MNCQECPDKNHCFKRALAVMTLLSREDVSWEEGWREELVNPSILNYIVRYTRIPSEGEEMLNSLDENLCK